MEIGPTAEPGASVQPPSDSPKSLAWPQRRSAACLLAWASLALWAMHLLATRWPYELHPLLLVLIIALPGIVFRAGDLLFMRQRQRRLAGWWRTGARLAALPVGIALALPLFSVLDSMSMARFEREIAAWVSQVPARPPELCPADGGVPIDAALNAYLEQSDALRKATLHHGDRRFVIEFAGRSIDIDGSTLYYDSATRQWQRFHNDQREQSDKFAALIEPLAHCRFTLS